MDAQTSDPSPVSAGSENKDNGDQVKNRKQHSPNNLGTLGGDNNLFKETKPSGPNNPKKRMRIEHEVLDHPDNPGSTGKPDAADKGTDVVLSQQNVVDNTVILTAIASPSPATVPAKRALNSPSAAGDGAHGEVQKKGNKKIKLSTSTLSASTCPPNHPNPRSTNQALNSLNKASKPNSRSIFLSGLPQTHGNPNNPNNPSVSKKKNPVSNSRNPYKPNESHRSTVDQKKNESTSNKANMAKKTALDSSSCTIVSDVSVGTKPKDKSGDNNLSKNPSSNPETKQNDAQKKRRPDQPRVRPGRGRGGLGLLGIRSLLQANARGSTNPRGRGRGRGRGSVAGSFTI